MRFLMDSLASTIQAHFVSGVWDDLFGSGFHVMTVI